MKILYISDHGPYSNTFIRQDVEIISKNLGTLYICFEMEKLYENKIIKTKLVKYPSYSLKSKIRWRLEKTNQLFNWYDKKFSRKIGIEITKFNPCIIHCQFSYESAKLLQNFQPDRPVIINFRGYGASSKLKNKHYVFWLRQLANNKSIYPIYVCRSLKQNLVEKKINFINPGIVLYTGINVDFFKRNSSKKKENNKIFIQVGHFNEKKGQEITIKAFANCINNSKLFKHKLIFIGSGKKLNYCKSLVKQMNIEKFVLFKGSLPQKEIIKELEQADIFVHHSLTAKNGDQEGIPNAILEAMSMEMPILSTFHSGIPEAVEHEVNGLLCKELDVKKYSSQMLSILSWGLLKNNRQKVINNFSLNKHIKLLEEFYNKIS